MPNGADPDVKPNSAPSDDANAESSHIDVTADSHDVTADLHDGIQSVLGAAGEAEASRTDQTAAETDLGGQAFDGSGRWWIVKAPGLSKGRGIELFSSLTKLLEYCYQADWKVLIQKYIETPLLLDGRKFDMRVWVTVVSWNPLVVYCWSEPYCRLSLSEFSLGGKVKTSDHLTNQSVQVACHFTFAPM